MTILSFRRCKVSNSTTAVAAAPASVLADVNVASSGTAEASAASSPPNHPAEGAGPFQNCPQAYPAGAKREGETHGSSGVGAGLPSLSLFRPSPPNTASLLRINEPRATPPATGGAISSAPPASSARTCHTCRRQILRSEGHISFVSHGGDEEHRYYHTDCFMCLHCNAPIDPRTQAFCCAKLLSGKKRTKMTNDGMNREDDDKNDDLVNHLMHHECFARHFGYMCVVCEKPLPMVGDRSDSYDYHDDKAKKKWKIKAMVKYIKHPYFDNERMCPHHATSASLGILGEDDPDALLSMDGGVSGIEGIDDRSHHTIASEEARIGSVRRCAGCHRFEPAFASSSKHFVDVGDKNTGRCVCLACIRTVVITSDDVVPLWEKVINFFEGPLGLITSEDIRGCDVGGVTRQDLMKIPILVVGSEAMNENVKHGAHGHCGTVSTRGLCLSETGGRSVGVTAILCLSGLPADLTASILAHEAFHAWIKLHPNFSYTNPLPRRVEEGLAQLAAFLFLSDGLDPIETEGYVYLRGRREGDFGDSRSLLEENDSSIPWEARLRQYFKFCIETDESMYGDGFRAAARAYRKLGIQELLYFVALNRNFPSI